MSASRLRSASGYTLVELLVVMLVFGILTAAVTSVVISTQRSEHFQGAVQETMDDARLSFQRIRKELRQARRVYHTSCEPSSVCTDTTDANGNAVTEASRLHFWVDANRSNTVEGSEQICYDIQLISGTTAQYRLMRWDNATTDCTSIPSTARVMAATLVPDPAIGTAPQPFVLDPPPTADPSDPATRAVTVDMFFQVESDLGPAERQFQSIIRLRNVA